MATSGFFLGERWVLFQEIPALALTWRLLVIAPAQMNGTGEFAVLPKQRTLDDSLIGWYLAKS
jgi:hypothetical protein